ncbi:MAG: S1 family peptidase [Bdellovibrionota bacterium]
MSLPLISLLGLLGPSAIADVAVIPLPVETPPALTAAAVPIAAPRTPLAAQDVNAAARGSVFRLSTSYSGANARALHGTAFVVDKSGLLITNFHVVRDSLLQNDELKLSLEVGGQNVGISVVAVDVVNDLALVRAARSFETALPVAEPASVAEGEVVYSFGFPASDQLTFIQGNYGGEKAMGFVTTGFAAMPLNSGMSGGPMLNSRAEVIGVNRAIIRTAQNLSFFSPLGALHDILSRGGGRSPSSLSDWKADAVAAVRRQEKATLATKLEGQREKLGGLSFTVPLPNQKCGQTRGEKQSGTPSSEMLVCQSNSLTPLVKESNALEVITLAMTSGKMFSTASRSLQASIRAMYDQERKGILEPPTKKGAKAAKDDDHETCGLNNVTNSHGVEMTISYCSVANSFYEGLFSTFVRVEIRNSTSITALGQMYQGLTADATADVLGQFLESIQTEEGT